jgi:hypothetical protein
VNFSPVSSSFPSFSSLLPNLCPRVLSLQGSTSPLFANQVLPLQGTHRAASSQIKHQSDSLVVFRALLPLDLLAKPCKLWHCANLARRIQIQPRHGRASLDQDGNSIVVTATVFFLSSCCPKAGRTHAPPDSAPPFALLPCSHVS